MSEFNTCAPEYHKFRPDYPENLFQFLIDSFALSKNSFVADIGCGTARASLPFAQQGIPVIGIDPSLEMLLLAKNTTSFINLPITFLQSKAENLALFDNSISFINCAQAFHWFNFEKALSEFSRILKPSGGLAIYWNNRNQEAASYLTKVENLILKYNPTHQLAYQTQNWELILSSSKKFKEIKYHSFFHQEELSIESFVGLTRSFSYVRNVLDDETKIVFENELKELLENVAVNGKVWLPYQVKLWCAKKIS